MNTGQPLSLRLYLLAVLVASALIVLVAMLANRHEPEPVAWRRAGGAEAPNPWAAVPPTTERPPRLDAPVAAVGREVVAHEAERASRSRRDVGGGVGGGGGGGWAALRQCENGGSYSDSSGPYYGAYQFDAQTWDSVGGAGHPGSASPAEQDAAAQRLYAQRGASPWPQCGRYLG